MLEEEVKSSNCTYAKFVAEYDTGNNATYGDSIPCKKRNRRHNDDSLFTTMIKNAKEQHGVVELDEKRWDELLNRVTDIKNHVFILEANDMMPKDDNYRYMDLISLYEEQKRNREQMVGLDLVKEDIPTVTQMEADRDAIKKLNHQDVVECYANNRNAENVNSIMLSVTCRRGYLRNFVATEYDTSKLNLTINLPLNRDVKSAHAHATMILVLESAWSSMAEDIALSKERYNTTTAKRYSCWHYKISFEGMRDCVGYLFTLFITKCGEMLNMPEAAIKMNKSIALCVLNAQVIAVEGTPLNEAAGYNNLGLVKIFDNIRKALVEICAEEDFEFDVGVSIDLEDSNFIRARKVFEAYQCLLNLFKITAEGREKGRLNCAKQNVGTSTVLLLSLIHI